MPERRLTIDLEARGGAFFDIGVRAVGPEDPINHPGVEVYALRCGCTVTRWLRDSPALGYVAGDAKLRVLAGCSMWHDFRLIGQFKTGR